VLDHWPVSAAQAAAGVTSWSLNGNHDMYSGGYGYFQTLLADPRFAAQRSPDGRTTSYFRLTSPSWDFVGLDTAWDTNVLSQGAVAVLEDPQAGFVAGVAQSSTRKLALLSHHQLVSVYDRSDIGPELADKLAPVLDSGRVTAWWWGHEHRCMGFEPTGGVQFPRCVGNGGVPVLQPHAEDDPIPPPGAWEARGYLEAGGEHWARFGYAVLDLDGPRMTVRYLDEEGTLVRSEEIA
jgi:3',5'-cyclic AMP phosphodiesterase CpdA